MVNVLRHGRPRNQIERIVLTGFGPFPGVPFNASAALVAHMAEEARRIPGIELATAILPVDWSTARVDSRRLIEASQPHAILHFGVSTTATGFEIETRAFNSASTKVDQVGGNSLAEYLRREGPPELLTNFPVEALAQALNLDGVPATVSDDAGRYLCNAVYYETLHICAMRPNPPIAVFIHLPALPEEVSTRPDPRWQNLLLGAEIILRFAARLGSPPEVGV